VLRQDPSDPLVVYAGTTAGLWKTTDGGRAFTLISPPNYILNGVLIDPRNAQRVLIATDRGGVFASDDAGASFYDSNEGFSQRQVTSLAADAKGDSLFAAVLNDKSFGGVFQWQNGGWTQLNAGIEELDVFDLAESTAGQLIAATNRGIFLFSKEQHRWLPSREVVNRSPARPAKPSRTAGDELGQMVRSSFAGRVNALAVDGRWYAATAAGLLRSEDEGRSWQGGTLDGEADFVAVAAHGELVAAASLRSLWRSSDRGEHWIRQPLPEWVTRIYSLTFTRDGELWMASREGALHWLGEGAGWEHVLRGLPARELGSVREVGERLMAIPLGGESVYVSSARGQSWQPLAGTRMEITAATLQNGRLYLATRYHGLLVCEAQAGANCSQR
jgi:photosystem II stability/assembly factor-like uncharacterized protein